MPLPMPEEEENLRCPHGERVQALMLCSLDCAVSGLIPTGKRKLMVGSSSRRGGA